MPETAQRLRVGLTPLPRLRARISAAREQHASGAGTSEGRSLLAVRPSHTLMLPYASRRFAMTTASCLRCFASLTTTHKHLDNPDANGYSAVHPAFDGVCRMTWQAACALSQGRRCGHGGRGVDASNADRRSPRCAASPRHPAPSLRPHASHLMINGSRGVFTPLKTLTWNEPDASSPPRLRLPRTARPPVCPKLHKDCGSD